MNGGPEDEERPETGMAIVPRHPESHGQGREDSTREDSTREDDGREDDAPLEALDPDEVLFPDPFRDPADFEPTPPAQARLTDLVELAGHIVFVLLVTVILPLTILWAGYRLYRWLPLETMALVIVSGGALWSYRDRLGPLLRRLLFGPKPH